MENEFKPILSQEDFEKAVKEQLEAQKKSLTDEIKKQYEGWISPEEAGKSAEKITALTAQVDDLTAKNSAHELNALRTKIAHETGLPYELSGRLQGADEAAIRADAEALAKLTAPKPVPSPGYSPETPAAASADAAFRALATELLP